MSSEQLAAAGQQPSRQGPRLQGLKVLHVCIHGMTFETCVQGLAEQQMREGCEVELACRRDEVSERMAAQGFKVHFMDIPPTFTKPLQSLRAMGQLRELIRRGGYDLVHSHTPLGGLHVNFVAKQGGARHLFYTVLGAYYMAPWNPLKRWIVTNVHIKVVKRADLVFAVAQHLREYLVSRGVRQERIVTLPGPGTNLERFSVDEDTRRQWREETRRQLGIPDDARVIVIVARVVPDKGIDELISALPMVRRRIPEARLLIVGNGPAEEPYRELAEEKGVAEAVTFAGWQPQEAVPRYLAAADVFALPSHREGLPLSPVEAWAVGLPVVMADIPPARELVDDGVNGLIVPVKAVEALADALVELLADERKARALAEKGKERAGQYSLKESVRRQIEAYWRYLEAAGWKPRG